MQQQQQITIIILSRSAFDFRLNFLNSNLLRYGNGKAKVKNSLHLCQLTRCLAVRTSLNLFMPNLRSTYQIKLKRLYSKEYDYLFYLIDYLLGCRQITTLIAEKVTFYKTCLWNNLKKRLVNRKIIHTFSRFYHGFIYSLQIAGTI